MAKFTSTVVRHGYLFRSQRELARYEELRTQVLSGEISELVVRPSFLIIGAQQVCGRWLKPVSYSASFQYLREGACVVEDVSKFTHTLDRIKQRLFLSQYGENIDYRAIAT